MNIFKQPELGYKKLNRCIKNVIFHFQMKCKFFEVLYKFTGKFSGPDGRDAAREMKFKKSSIFLFVFFCLYREKRRPVRFTCRVKGTARRLLLPSRPLQSACVARTTIRTVLQDIIGD